MKNIHKTLIFAALLSLAAACSDDEDVERPVITAEGIAASPVNCDSYVLGDTIRLCYRFTDNEELGNFNIEVHTNHDHHTHSGEAEDCPREAEEGHEHEHEAVNPWVLNKDYTIPAGTRDYTARVEIPIPEDVSEGEYHFMIRVTDRAGWMEMKSLSIMLVD